MLQRANLPRIIPCILLVVSLLLSAVAGGLPDLPEASAPWSAEHAHESDIVHSHAEHPEGVFEFHFFFADNRQESGQLLAGVAVSWLESTDVV